MSPHTNTVTVSGDDAVTARFWQLGRWLPVKLDDDPDLVRAGPTSCAVAAETKQNTVQVVARIGFMGDLRRAMARGTGTGATRMLPSRRRRGRHLTIGTLMRSVLCSSPLAPRYQSWKNRSCAVR